MIEQLLKELHETWGYETEELNDIREKMEELGNTCYREGYIDASEEFREKTIYGKKEDMEFYD